MIRVLLTGNERLTQEQTEALTKGFEKLGASVKLFPTNTCGARFNWTEFTETLRNKTHFILVVGKGANYVTLLEDAVKTWGRKVAVVYLDGTSLDLHSRLLGERHLDLAIVSTPLDHSRVPRGCSQSMIAENLVRSADEIAKKFIGKVLVN